MKCRMCGEDRKLIEAHIIPRSFYEPLKENGQIPRIITDKAGVYPKRSQTGAYDKEIVCENCEQMFSPWDDYGYNFLFQELDEANYISDGGRAVAYNFGKCDVEKLKLFFLSVLWRASVSKHDIFHDVQLGPFEEKLRALLLSGDSGDNSEFAIALSKFDAPANKTGILAPDRTRYNGVNHYRFYMAGYMAAIKVSKSRSSETFEKLYFSPGKNVYCIIREFDKSGEYKALINAVLNADKPGRANKSRKADA
ncbi:hypothetical protein KO508_13640 [Marinobacter salexigens]|uniref:HNH endonuclease 5 domain-containing protein n=1 Tax=Marinobacter salexigens TaxID=1925763 RepID=A0ABS6AA72_9GAMM|nr:hypothetical protein [Marinobacter salexigens]